MSEEQQARFEQLPGNITLNSLYIPHGGSSHIVMGSSNSKQEALQAVHKHLEAFGVHRFDEPTPDALDWKDIGNRDTDYTSTSYNTLPIRSQRGVEAKIHPALTAKIYSDDYSTGQIPWSIRLGSSRYDHDDFHQLHNHIKDYFKQEGNQKTSWKERYNAR